jgi:hypothetical protein
MRRRLSKGLCVEVLGGRSRPAARSIGEAVWR